MNSATDFRALCHRHHLAATHQRQVIYEAVTSLAGHPSPEAIYGKVRKKVPSISLATVYKNIRTFLDRGLLQEVSLHHGSLRVESNHAPHHHLVYIHCRSIMDFDEAGLGPLQLRKLPRGFQVKRIAVDILGICRACASKDTRGSTRKT
jgi:Fur family transcriptional regulator, peroxide stress response regulator